LVVALVFQNSVAFIPDIRSALTVRPGKIWAESGSDAGKRRGQGIVKVCTAVQPFHTPRDMMAFIDGLAKYRICCDDQQSRNKHRKPSSKDG